MFSSRELPLLLGLAVGALAVHEHDGRAIKDAQQLRMDAWDAEMDAFPGDGNMTSIIYLPLVDLQLSCADVDPVLNEIRADHGPEPPQSTHLEMNCVVMKPGKPQPTSTSTTSGSSTSTTSSSTKSSTTESSTTESGMTESSPTESSTSESSTSESNTTESSTSESSTSESNTTESGMMESSKISETEKTSKTKKTASSLTPSPTMTPPPTTATTTTKFKEKHVPAKICPPPKHGGHAECEWVKDGGPRKGLKEYGGERRRGVSYDIALGAAARVPGHGLLKWRGWTVIPKSFYKDFFVGELVQGNMTKPIRQPRPELLKAHEEALAAFFHPHNQIAKAVWDKNFDNDPGIEPPAPWNCEGMINCTHEDSKHAPANCCLGHPSWRGTTVLPARAPPGGISTEEEPIDDKCNIWVVLQEYVKGIPKQLFHALQAMSKHNRAVKDRAEDLGEDDTWQKSDHVAMVRDAVKANAKHIKNVTNGCVDIGPEEKRALADGAWALIHAISAEADMWEIMLEMGYHRQNVYEPPHGGIWSPWSAPEARALDLVPQGDRSVQFVEVWTTSFVSDTRPTDE